MKNFAIVGMGRFGKSMLERLMRRGSEVLVIDNDEQKIQWARDRATRVIQADAMDIDTLKEVLPDKLECAIIDTGRDHLERSILITNYLHKLGLGHIIVHALSPSHAEILQIVGATLSVFPEEEAAERLAGILVGRGRLDYFPVSSNFSVMEVSVPKNWVGKSLLELDVRQSQHVNVVALRDSRDEEGWRFPEPTYRFQPSDIVLLAGKTKDLERQSE
ncbi:MAG: TrkA family potassium uptake protein [Planctomycetota bacterium]|nr:MAG: TrkA family potassium uptake protein [Planctomycetota bacterium]